MKHKYRVQIRVGASIQERTVRATTAERAISAGHRAVQRDGWKRSDCGPGYAERVDDPHDVAGRSPYADDPKVW